MSGSTARGKQSWCSLSVVAPTRWPRSRATATWPTARSHGTGTGPILKPAALGVRGKLQSGLSCTQHARRASHPAPPPLERAAKACPLLEDPHNRKAWAECCTKRFLATARRIAGDDHLAEDALQESWSRVLRHVCKYHGGDPACAWVRSIVANCAKDLWSERQRERQRTAGPPSEDLADPAQDPEALAQRQELIGLLLRMVETLPEMYREVCRLRYLEDRSAAETARLLGVSRSTVSTRLNRAVEMLRNRLEARLHVKERKHPKES